MSFGGKQIPVAVNASSPLGASEVLAPFGELGDNLGICVGVVAAVDVCSENCAGFGALGELVEGFGSGVGGRRSEGDREESEDHGAELHFELGGLGL